MVIVKRGALQTAMASGLTRGRDRAAVQPVAKSPRT
jgi:hypothetical protein